MAEPMDRHARQDARAKAVIERERAHQEKRKNGLPPFLMVRSGLLNGWLVTLCALGIATWSAGFASNASNGLVGDVAVGAVAFAGLCYGAFSTKIKYQGFKQDIETIKVEFEKYINNDKYTLDFSDYVQNNKLMHILIDHIMKYDDGAIIDKIKADPNSVLALDVLNAILKSYLHRHPENAQIIRDKIPEDKMYDTVRRIIDKQTKRLANCEQCK